MSFSINEYSQMMNFYFLCYSLILKYNRVECTRLIYSVSTRPTQ